MKGPLALIIPACFFLTACDKIKNVGGKLDELTEKRKETAAEAEPKEKPAPKGTIEKSGPAVQELAASEFSDFINQPGRLHIVDFYADWCGPCRKLTPVLSSVVQENSRGVRLGKINVDQARDLAAKEGVSSIPDVRFYIDGKLVHKFVGAVPRSEIERLVGVYAVSMQPRKAPAPAPQASPSKKTKSTQTKSAPTAPGQQRPTNAKPIEEAIQPMEKEWLPPGVSRDNTTPAE